MGTGIKSVSSCSLEISSMKVKGEKILETMEMQMLRKIWRWHLKTRKKGTEIN